VVRSIVVDEGFRLNEAKSRIRGAADRHLLAGLVVNAAPAVPRDEYDALRALLHNTIYTGLEEQNRDGHPDFVAHLAGRIAWVSQRHPIRAAKLHTLLERALPAHPRRPPPDRYLPRWMAVSSPGPIARSSPQRSS